MKILVTGASGFLGGWGLSTLSNKFGKESVTGTGRNQVRCDELKEIGLEKLVPLTTFRRRGLTICSRS